MDDKVGIISVSDEINSRSGGGSHACYIRIRISYTRYAAFISVMRYAAKLATTHYIGMTQQTQNVQPMPVQSCPIVFDAGLTLYQH